jgi:rhodanese-related sulfurtransferase
MKTFKQLVEECSKRINEVFPWDLAEQLHQKNILIIDIREPAEYAAMHIADSLNVPRGILETACEYDYEDTVPALATARQQHIVLVCRSGNRSVFAAEVMQQMGYQQVWSLRTGLRGWNDSEQPLLDSHGMPVDLEAADAYFTVTLRPDQQRPKTA